MHDPQPLPIWIIPLFPLFFAAIWILVVSLLAELGGWSVLARHFREPDGFARSPVRSFSAVSLALQRGALPLPVSYNSCVVAEIAPAGLHLRVWMIFRLRHPPLLIPWSAIEGMEPGKALLGPTTTIHLHGVPTRIRIYGGVGSSVEEVWRQFTAQARQPAPA
jgi:hypothetical protein